MGKMSRSGRSGLNNLDREILQIVRKVQDDQVQYEGLKNRLTTSFIYDRIKRSNSSLARQPKRLLEDCIERVLTVLQEDEKDDEDDFRSVEDEIDANGLISETASNKLNRSLVSAWSKAPAAPVVVPTTDAKAEDETKPKVVKKRERDGEPIMKKRKAVSETDRSPPTHVSIDDMGGVEDVLIELRHLVARPILFPNFYKSGGIDPPRGILLHGPPGCGKTMLANAYAGKLGVPFISVSGPSIVSGMSGESEKALRDLFDESKKLAPCIMFIDEIDAITPKRESAQREMEKRIVAQLLTCMDDISFSKTNDKAVIVIAATNRPDSLDPALRRAGRFDTEINMGVPNEPTREEILKALTRTKKIQDVDFRSLAKRTPGFVGADLSDLVNKAGATAMTRAADQLFNDESMDVDQETSISSEVQKLDMLINLAKDKEHAVGLEWFITGEDFEIVLPKIQPSSKREGFATIPDTTWAHVGALHDVREKLTTAIVDPIKFPERYARVGITTPSGVILHGPPGCGKTLLAKAVANESKANFISVKGAELMNKFVGESERAIRQVFLRARSSKPCVVFFDELDAIAGNRANASEGSGTRVVNTLLTELDGLSDREGIYVIAATNMLELIDDAVLRPGRFGEQVFVDFPSAEARVEILRTLLRTRKIALPFEDEVVQLGLECIGFSGADLGQMVRKAGEFAVKRDDELKVEDFVRASKLVKPVSALRTHKKRKLVE